MKRASKILSIAIAVLVAVVLIAWLGFKAYARTDAFHAKMQAVASRGMGMQVSLDRRIGHCDDGAVKSDHHDPECDGQQRESRIAPQPARCAPSGRRSDVGRADRCPRFHNDVTLKQVS